jgi:hypothetical protein
MCMVFFSEIFSANLSSQLHYSTKISNSQSQQPLCTIYSHHLFMFVYIYVYLWPFFACSVLVLANALLVNRILHLPTFRSLCLTYLRTCFKIRDFYQTSRSARRPTLFLVSFHTQPNHLGLLVNESSSTCSKFSFLCSRSPIFSILTSLLLVENCEYGIEVPSDHSDICS